MAEQKGESGEHSTAPGWGLWLGWVLASSVGGAVYGAITSSALVWLLRQRRPGADAAAAAVGLRPVPADRREPVAGPAPTEPR